MPKIPKNKKKRSRKNMTKQERIQLLKIEQANKKQQMFQSTVITYLLALVFFILSLLFNAEYISLNFGESTGAQVGEIALKSVPVILFFFFMLVAVGNYQEMRGYIVTWKELVALLVLSFLLAGSSGWVFFISFLGISLIITYLYFLQGKDLE